jgi:Methyltransferase domain
LLVRIMRDLGFDFYWYDKYCSNIFTKHFVANRETRYELLTAFEVFEHLGDPLTEIKAMLAFSNNLLFSTQLVPNGVQNVSDWWYFAPEHGQHVAFYTVESLQVISKVFNLHLSTDGVGTHLLSQKPVSNRLFRFFARETRQSRLVRWLLRTQMRKRSLLLDDFQAVSGYRI